MKSFFLTLRLLGYHYGLPTKPEYLIPSARFYQSDPLKRSLTLKSDHVASEIKIKTKEEIQASTFLHLAKEHYNKKQTQKAQENIEKALLLAKSSAENEFSPDLVLEMYYLRGYIMLQKKKLMSAYSNFNTFLQLRDQHPKPHTVQDTRLRLEILGILMSDRNNPGLEAYVEKIIYSLTVQTEPEQLILKAQCYQVLSEHQAAAEDIYNAIDNGVKCLEILESPEIKNSEARPEIADMKVGVVKAFVKICESLQGYGSYHFPQILPKIAKIIQETKGELEIHRTAFALILPKFFEWSTKIRKNKEINQEIFGILQEAKFEEKDFSSKKEYIEYMISVADGMLNLEYYTEDSKLLNQISEALDDLQVSSEILARYFYLKSQYAYENKNYQEVFYYKRLYHETRPGKMSQYLEVKGHFSLHRSPDLNDLNIYIIGIKTNVKLQKLDEAIEEIPLYLEECLQESFFTEDRNLIDDESRSDLREFLAKNTQDVRWEKWLKEIKDDEKGTPAFVMHRYRASFVLLNMLILCAKNKQFSLAEDCAMKIKNRYTSLPPDFAKKSDFLLHSSLVKDCMELLEDQLEGNTYLVSIAGLIPIFSQRKLLRGNIFILEEIDGKVANNKGVGVL